MSTALGAPGDGLAALQHPAPLTYDLPIDASQLPPFCYVSGPAGTGKTFWAKALAAASPGCTLAATTGIAAVNLGEGTTINALLRYYNTDSLREAYTGGFLETILTKHRRAGLQTIILDEVSMMDGDQLTLLVRAMDNVNTTRTADDPELKLVLVGDFAQLAPVNAPFAFESAEWERFAGHTFSLSTIRRQADREFIEALQATRRGDGAKALEYFGPYLQDVTLMDYPGPTVVAKNNAVDKYNQLAMDKLKGASCEYPSSRWGKLRSDWGGPPKPKPEWGIPENLCLRDEARVMVLANRNIAEPGEPACYAYTNGDLGTFLAKVGGTAKVKLDRTGEEVTVVPVERENLIPLEPGRRKELKAEGRGHLAKERHEVIGGISYLPLRLAYATTVHKSQGLSLDSVQVNIRDHFFSQPGMLYVALSRARTMAGLRIVGTPTGFKARCNTNKKILKWL
jgi:ATP-dependent exoDNAse (exonuclease V) alpha subunit